MHSFSESLDKWLNSATARRNNALKLLEYYCGRPDDSSEAIAIEYQEIEPDKPAQIASPSLAPEEGANDIAAENHSEPVELAKE